MDSLQVLEPNDPREVGHHLLVAVLRRQVEAGCEGVARVETDADPRLVCHLLYDGRQLLKPPTDSVPLPAHVL